MNNIKYTLTNEEYCALVIKIEDLQLARLQKPTNNAGRQGQERGGEWRSA